MPAAVIYRAISTWLTLLIGWVVLAALRRRDRHTPDVASTAPPLASATDDMHHNHTGTRRNDVKAA